MSIRVDVIKNHLPEFALVLPKAVGSGIDEGLAKVEAIAKQDCPTDSGALQASGYRITPDTNEYQDAVSAMGSLNDKASATGEPTVAADEGVVGFAADYALPVHDGHHTRSGSMVAGRPFLAQAYESQQQAIVDAIARKIEEAATLLSVF